jgi:glyoxylase-like metal-dependent hydrolase (beta-lactamase superfamily II)
MSLKDRRTRGPKKLLVFCVTTLVIAGLIAVMYINRADNGQGEITDPIFVPVATTFAPGLHLLGALSPSVAYVVETSEGLILIDAGLEDEHPILLQQFETLGLDIQNLKMILVTHGHGDHYLGAMSLQRLTGAKIYVGKGDSSVLRDAGPRESVFSTFPMDHVNIHPTVVDVELVGGETIAMGAARIQVIATPGHTPGSVCYLLELNERTALFSGDTIMTITGDLGTYSTYLPPRYKGDAGNYLATLRELEKIPVPDLLLPGHPRTDLGVISAKVSPEDWSSLLSRGIQQMEELTKRYAADGSDFLDGNPKELIPGLHYLGDISGTAVYCFVDQSSLILLDAPGGPELVSFLDQQLGNIGLDLSILKAVVLTSADPKSTGGLAPLVEKTGCQIIAAQADWEDIRGVVPNATVLLPEATGQQFAWLPLQSIPISGFGRTRTAYRIEWKGKRILISGRIPLKITRETASDLEQMSLDRTKITQSLSRLQQVQPDLWLPARPVHGQNANLYGSDWGDVLREIRLSLGLREPE